MGIFLRKLRGGNESLPTRIIRWPAWLPWTRSSSSWSLRTAAWRLSWWPAWISWWTWWTSATAARTVLSWATAWRIWTAAAWRLWTAATWWIWTAASSYAAAVATVFAAVVCVVLQAHSPSGYADASGVVSLGGCAPLQQD